MWQTLNENQITVGSQHDHPPGRMGSEKSPDAISGLKNHDDKK